MNRCSFTRLVGQTRKEPYSATKKPLVFFYFCCSDWNDQRLHLHHSQQPLSSWRVQNQNKSMEWQSTMLPILQTRNFTKLHLLRFSSWIRLTLVKELFLPRMSVQILMCFWTVISYNSSNFSFLLMLMISLSY